MKQMIRACVALPLAALGMSPLVQAYDVTDRFSVGAVLAGSGQCQGLSDDAGANDECKGAIPLQMELSLRPTENDEFFTKFGFATGNGLNSSDDRFRSPFVLATWAADLEDDVEDINGRSRDYLLTGWYKHTFRMNDESSLGLSFGIIDSTDYLGENAYANDEFTQFMNEAFVNNTQSFLPSYDAGGAVAWDSGNWSLRGVVMNVGENDNGNEYNFLGATVGYGAENSQGEGNYRLTVTTTNDKFTNESGTGDESLLGVGLSFDQQLGDHLGAFTRIGWQDDDAAVTYETLVSGGLDINAGLWSRSDDNIGVGLAWLDGGNLDVDETYVFETYYRAVFGDHIAVTADVQWMSDKYNSGGDDAEGWIFGLRATSEF